MILQVGAVYVPPLSRGLLTIVVPSIRPKIKASFLMGVPAPWGPRLTSHDNSPISPSIYIPRKSKDQTLTVGSRESFTWIIPRTILCLVLDFQGIPTKNTHRFFRINERGGISSERRLRKGGERAGEPEPGADRY